jgi:serine/threonine protein phosphatase 1
VVRTWFNNDGLPTVSNCDYELGLRYARQAITLEYEHHIEHSRRASLIELDDAFAFFHARIDPDRAVDDQNRRDCLWIRKSFLEHVAPLSHVIVHGHMVTESRRPVITSNRIAIDTQVYTTGSLTTVIIDPVARWVNFAWPTRSDFWVSVGPVKPIRSGSPEALCHSACNIDPLSRGIGVQN